MSSERIKREIQDTAIFGERLLTSLLYVQVALNAAKSQKLYAMAASGSGRAMMRHTGMNMHGCMNNAGQDLNDFRQRLRDTHIPTELRPKVSEFLRLTVRPFEHLLKTQMYREDVRIVEQRVEEVTNYTAALLHEMRSFGGY